MQKYTITRVGSEKEINTKFGPKKKTGVMFKETGDIWHDIWKAANQLSVGQVLEGTRDSREYNGKIYWDFKLPKKDEVAVIKTDALEKRVKVLEDEVFKGKAVPSTESSDPDGLDDINPDDIPF